MDLVLPYSAFDFNVTTPVIKNSTSFYFPIKPTSDDTEYTLGRTFLQETYVTTHYNSRTFNVSQCIFDDTASAHVVALPSHLPTSTSNSSSNPGSGTGSGSGGGKKLAGGAIAGIVIGALVAILLAVLLFCLFRRRGQNKQTSHPAEEEVKAHAAAIEIDSGKRVDPQTTSAYIAQASSVTNEVDGNDARVEKWGVPVIVPQELPANEIPEPSNSDVSSESGGGWEEDGYEGPGPDSGE